MKKRGKINFLYIVLSHIELSTTRMEVYTDKVHKFLSCLGVFHKSTGEIARRRHRILFLHTTHSHTKMLCLNYYGHTQWIQRLLNALFDLLGETFLHLQTTGKSIHHTWYLTDAHNSTIGYIS